MNINERVETAGTRAKVNGWHADMPNAKTHPKEHLAWIGSKLMLTNSELTEAFEELRGGRDVEEIYYSEGGKPEGFLVELADVMIRLGDLIYSVAPNSDIEQTIKEKLEYNDTRGKMHGGKKI